jgi:hypothetical protein
MIVLQLCRSRRQDCATEQQTDYAHHRVFERKHDVPTFQFGDVGATNSIFGTGRA